MKVGSGFPYAWALVIHLAADNLSSMIRPGDGSWLDLSSYGQ